MVVAAVLLMLSLTGTKYNTLDILSNCHPMWIVVLGLPPRCQKVLEAMGRELNSMNPAFTIRRTLQHAQEEIELIEKLRKVCYHEFVVN